MNWYYVMNGAQQGPVSAEEMQRYLGQGVITGATLVWNATMTDWLPLDTTELARPGGLPAGHERCIVTGKVCPTTEMLQSEHGWVSAEGKDKYYQSLREGVAPQLAGGGTAFTAWRDGKHMVVPVTDAVLPPRCVKTNVFVQPSEFRRRNFVWVHWGVLLTILLGWIITIILYFVLRKKVTLTLPVADAALRSVRTNVTISWALVVSGIAAIIGTVAGGEFDDYWWVVLVGCGLLLAGAIFGSLRGRLVRVAKVKGTMAWIGGVHPDFLAALPPYQG